MLRYDNRLIKKCQEVLNRDSEKFVFYECGVYTGRSAKLIADQILSSQKNVIFKLFDTFEGIPEVNTQFDNEHKKGDFSDFYGIDIVKEMASYKFIQMEKGFMPDTFEAHKADKIDFAHIDVDIYDSHNDCFDFIFPRLVKNGYMVCHDYGHPSCEGATIAIDDFLEKQKEKIRFEYFGSFPSHAIPNRENARSIFIEKIN